MKLKNELIVICLILFILISISTVSAVDGNTNVITENNDDTEILNINNVNNEILTDENDGSFADLNTTINGDSSTNIILEKDYTYSSSDTITNGIVISKNNIVIDGQGHTIDAKYQSRIFNVTSTTLILKNIKFVNGNDDVGGAIRSYGDNLRIINCTFINNTAETWGGAVDSYPDSLGVFINSTFINNNAKNGGAISTGYFEEYGIKHYVINCTFENNTAINNGGAILVKGKQEYTDRPYADTLIISGSKFIGNKAKYGDAVSDYNSATINFTNCIILGNAENLIDANVYFVYADYNWFGNTYDNRSVRPNISKYVEVNKWLYFDFAPRIETSTATVSINNLYDSKTGQTSTYSTSKLPSAKVEFNGVNVTFASDNAYLGPSGKYEIGFALNGTAVLTANCSNAIISKKIKAGGLKELELLIANFDGSVLKLDKDYVYTEGKDNKIGIQISDKHDLVIDGNGYTINGMGKSRVFAVLKNSSDITFKNMYISGGYTDDSVDGAGAYVEAVNTNFINCTFLNNVANGYGSGGALHVTSNDVKIIDCNFINNTHLYSAGGAISWRKGDAYIINTIFENNSADFTYAGALMLYNGGYIQNCTFNHNTAGHAGAIFNYNWVNITDCTFISNIAFTDEYTYGGGAIYTPNATISNSVFIGNKAISGAAVTITSPSVVIDKSLFINNTITSSSGIVASISTGGKVINSIFLNNDVGNYGYPISTIFGGLEADYNWYGNIWKNYNSLPNMDNRATMTKWLFLNASGPAINGNNLQTNFTFLVYDDNTKMFAQYDIDDLPSVNLKLSGQNLTLKQDSSIVGENINGITTYHKGNLIAEYESVKYVLPFKVQEKSYFIVNSTFNIEKGQSEYLGAVLYPFDNDYMYFLYNAGRITYTINDTSIFSFNKANDKITGLKVGLATITLKFNGINVIGEDRYTPANVTILVNVTKAATRIINSTSAPSDTYVGDNANFIVSVVDSKNRSIRGATLEIINNNPDVIKLTGYGNNVQYKTLAEGLANITVRFVGNDEYLPSSRDFTFQVGRKDPEIRVDPENISMLVSQIYYVAIYTWASDNFTYISNDTSVAVFDGKAVQAVGEGVANITIRFGGDARYYPSEVYMIVTVGAVKTYIDVNQTKTLYLTDTESISPVVRDINGKFIGYAYEYSSNDTSVVTIDDACTITAISVGKANITIKFNARNEYAPSVAYIIVTVETATNNINVASDVEIQVDQIVNLNATLDYGRGLFYESTNSSIVTVDSRGNIKGIRTGEANVTITYKGTEKYDPSSKNVTVRVVKVPTNIDVANSLAWIIGENDIVNATLNPKNAGSLTFKSNDENIVTINQTTGEIIAVGVGKTTVEVSYGGTDKYAASNKTIEVNVYSSYVPTSIEVNKSIELHVDDVIDIGAILNPANAGELTYASSNKDIVAVNQTTGKITGVKVGEATITISFAGNNAYLANSTEVLVKVSLIQTSIEANNSLSVNKTEDVPFDYVFSHPEAGQVRTSFADPSIAHIENGKIVGDKVGKTVLTIKFAGNEKYAASNTTVEVIVTDVETMIDVADRFEVNLTETDTIEAQLNPQEAGKLKFTNYDDSIISIDTNGKVTGLNLGSTNVTISFKDENSKYRSSNKTITVVVKDVETSIEASDIEVNVTETGFIDAKLNPQKAGKLIYTSTNTSVITVDDDGNVKGIKVGEADVIVKFDATGKYRQSTKTVHVVVRDVATNIEVDSDKINLLYGDETNVNATLTPNVAGEIAYSTNDSSVISVDEDGNIKAVKPGVATILISYAGEGKYKSSNKTVVVNVSRAPSSIVINDNMDLEIGVGIILRPATGPNNIRLIYATSDNETVSVDENGFIQALKYGSAAITINYAGDEYYLPSNATINVNIKSIATQIRVNNTITIGYGESKALEAVIFVPVAQYTLNDKLRYESSDSEIVSVDEKTGLITANKVGKANITVSYDGNSIYESSNATVNVEVTTRTTGIKVNEPEINLYVEETGMISASLRNGPDGAKLNYITSNPNVAIVNPITGEVTARAEGTATVTVKYMGDDEYHSSEANVTVTVSKYKTQIKSKNSYELNVYDNLDLNAIVTPNEGILTYVSGNDDIVTVDANGNIKAHKAGSAVVTIKFAGDNKYSPSKKEVIVTVNKIPTSINLTDMKLYANEEYKLGKIVLPDGVPTRAKYYEYISWDSEVFDVDNGIITTFHEGTSELYVAFLGDDAYLPSNITVEVTVVKKVISEQDYNFTVEVDDDAQEATFTITLPDDAEGMFQIIVDGEVYAEDISDGKAVITVGELGTGDHKATLRYTGDEKYASINNATTFHIGKYKIDKNQDVDVYLGDYATYKVHLTKDTQAMEGKKIKFRVNGKNYYAFTDRLGYASIKVKLPAMKTYTVTAQFGSVKVSNKIKVHVVVAKNLKTKKTKNLKVQITLKKVNKKYLSGKKVTLKFNGKTYTANTNSKGVATFTINKNAFSKLKVGKSYKYTVKYSTDTVTKNIKIF